MNNLNNTFVKATQKHPCNIEEISAQKWKNWIKLNELLFLQERVGYCWLDDWLQFYQPRTACANNWPNGWDENVWECCTEIFLCQLK